MVREPPGSQNAPLMIYRIAAAPATITPIASKVIAVPPYVLMVSRSA